MTIVKTRVQAGRVELAVPGDWPNGLEVEIRPLAVTSSNDDDLMTPEEIAKTLAAMRAMKPMDENSEVHEKTEELINERKQREKADFLDHLERLIHKKHGVFERACGEVALGHRLGISTDLND